MSSLHQEIWLVRHGETEWSRSGQHTGRTDLPLLDAGREQAIQLGRQLQTQDFSLVLSSPLQRARETCRLAGFGDRVELTDELREWDYGVYEGRTTADIRKDEPDWSVWTSPITNGETIQQVGARVQRVIDRATSAHGNAVLFAHGHCLRILTACWLGLPPTGGRLFALNAGSISILGYEHGTRVLRQWNRLS